MALQGILSAQGYEIITAGDGVTALNRANRDVPSLIVSDVVLPGLSGYHLCRLLKNDSNTRDMPIILLTSLDHKSDRFWGLEAGADLYLEKQGSPEPILEAIAELLRDIHPSPHGTAAVSERSASFSDFSATARLNTLLDQLLFESTVRSAVRGMGGDVGERQSFHLKLFELLERVLDYDVAALFIHSPQGIQIAFDALSPITSHDLHALCDTIQDRLTPDIVGQQTLQLKVTNPEMVHDQAPAFVANSQTDLSFDIDRDIWGAIVLYSSRENAYSPELLSILHIVGDELARVLHSSAKTEEIERLKADFTAMLVHDLRSPLCTILGFTELVLMDEQDGSTNPTHRRHIERVHRKGRDMLGLVNDILELSKLEAGRLELSLESVEAGELISRVCQDMMVLADEAELNFDVQLSDSLPTMRADQHRLERVLVNLLSNAIKFTPEGGQVTLNAWHQSEPGPVDVSDYVFISVSDTGPGIPQDKAKLLFSKYQQANGGHERIGTGLGLAICKEIVEVHQGRIWLQSQVGEGTTVTVLLPVQGPAELVSAELSRGQETSKLA
jgi:signal transduction histidine kinase